MWTCSTCRTKVDPSFEICWNCGTSADGVVDPSFVPADAPTADTSSPLDLNMPEGTDPIPEPINDAAGELVECYWALDLMQAKFLADRLSEAGIPAMADTQDMQDALGSMSSNPRVWVRAGDLPRAKMWLEEFDRRNAEEHGGG